MVGTDEKRIKDVQSDSLPLEFGDPTTYILLHMNKQYIKWNFGEKKS